VLVGTVLVLALVILVLLVFGNAVVLSNLNWELSWGPDISLSESAAMWQAKKRVLLHVERAGAGVFTLLFLSSLVLLVKASKRAPQVLVFSMLAFRLFKVGTAIGHVALHYAPSDAEGLLGAWARARFLQMFSAHSKTILLLAILASVWIACFRFSKAVRAVFVK